MRILIGNVQIFVLVLIKTNAEIPIDFPANKARMIPIPRLEKICGMLSAVKVIVVLTKAKIGSII